MKKVTTRKPKVKLSSIVNKVILKFVKMGPDKWIKGNDAKDAKGCTVHPLDKQACAFCNQGVLLKVLNTRNRSGVFYAINEQYRLANKYGSDMVGFNDSAGTTFGENLEMWFKVREALKAQGK